MKETIKKLMLPSEGIQNFCGKMSVIVAAVVFYSVMAPVYFMFGLLPAVIAMAVTVVLFFLLKLGRFYGSNSAVSLVLSLVLSIFLSKELKTFLHSLTDHNYNSILETVCLSLFIFSLLTLIFGILLYYGALDKLNMKGLRRMTLGGGTMLFLVFIFIPCDSYINNFSDFNFPLTAFIFIFLGQFFLY